MQPKANNENRKPRLLPISSDKRVDKDKRSRSQGGVDKRDEKDQRPSRAASADDRKTQAQRKPDDQGMTNRKSNPYRKLSPAASPKPDQKSRSADHKQDHGKKARSPKVMSLANEHRFYIHSYIKVSMIYIRERQRRSSKTNK